MEENSPKKEQSAQQNGGQPPTENDPKPKQTILILLVAAISFALWQIADHFNGFLGDFFHFISVCFGLADASYAIQESSHLRQKIIWASYGVLCIIVGLVYFWPKPAPPKPNLIFCLTTTHATNSLLEITNAFLRTDQLVAGLSPTSAVLAIATFQEEQTVELQFELGNEPDSIDVNDLEVSAYLPMTAAFSTESGWIHVLNEGFPENKETLIFRVKFPQPLFPGDSVNLPRIEFSSTQPPDPLSGRVKPILFRVTDRGVVLYNIGFWLYLAKMPPGDSTLVIPQMFSRVVAIGFSNDEFVVSHIRR
jgi:hypothetical protein